MDKRDYSMDEDLAEWQERQDEQRRFREAEVTSDHSVISALIAGEDENTKCYLVDNPNLTDSEVWALADDKAVAVRIELAKSKQVTSKALLKLMQDKSDVVRVFALCHPLTDDSYLVEAILHDKFSATAKKLLCESFRVLGNLEVFEFLWKTVKNGPAILMDTLVGETYQTVPVIDPKVRLFVHQEILSGNASNAVRETYAGSAGIASPEILDRLKDDPYRPVINAIARNAVAWVSTHDYLASKHKTSEIRTSIAMVTTDNDLLNKIYNGTKSKDIRFWVEENPMFVLRGE